MDGIIEKKIVKILLFPLKLKDIIIVRKNS